MPNTYSVDELDQSRNIVRLNISDTDTAAGKYIFDDKEIDAFLTVENGVLLAAARALEVIAANEVLVQKRIEILDLKTDGPAEAKELRTIAKQWRDQVAAAEEAAVDAEDAGFDIAEVVYDDFGARQRFVNEVLRDGT